MACSSRVNSSMADSSRGEGLRPPRLCALELAFPDCLVAGAFRLPPRLQRVPYSRIMFGRYKGRRMDELPGDYLEWLLKEQPKKLRPGQLEEAAKIVNERAGHKHAADEVEALLRDGEYRQQLRARMDDMDYRRQQREMPHVRQEQELYELDPEFFGDLPPPGQPPPDKS